MVRFGRPDCLSHKLCQASFNRKWLVQKFFNTVSAAYFSLIAYAYIRIRKRMRIFDLFCSKFICKPHA